MYICDIYVISFVCVDGIQKTNKKVYTGHFAECNTRQRGALSSVRVIKLGKEQKPGHRFRDFAECYVAGTRQRGRLCRVPHRALGKEPDMGTLPGGLFAECPRGHSAKMYSLPSASGKTLGKDAVSVTRHRNGRFSLPSAPWHSANLFAEYPRKSTRQRRLCRCTVCRAFFAECHTRQSLCRVFLRLCRVLRALGKASVSGSERREYICWLSYIMSNNLTSLNIQIEVSTELVPEFFSFQFHFMGIIC
jgi:hypothetical protein